jgi:hypothetical protein
MTRKTQIKPFVLILLAVYIFLSVFMTFGAMPMAGHPMGPAGHAQQHSNLFCHWMCTASAFVHSADQPISDGVKAPSVERPVLYSQPVLEHLSLSSFPIRPPPDFSA